MDSDERYTNKGQLLTPKENIDPQPQLLISGIEDDTLSNDIATEFEVQQSDQAVEQSAIDSVWKTKLGMKREGHLKHLREKTNT